MKQEITETIEIPEGIEMDIGQDAIIVKKGKEEIKLKFREVNVEKEGNSLKLYNKRGNKRDRRQIKTFIAHINNAMNGLSKHFAYKLQIAYVHFPMNVTYDSAKKEILIKNFLGEKKARVAKIEDGVEVKIEKDIIILTSHNKEEAGQSAANIEHATKIRNRDRRVFQDGIYLISRGDKTGGNL